MIDIVDKYEDLLFSLPELIKKSHFKAEFFAEGLNLKLPTYYRKLKQRNFSLPEVRKIIILIDKKQSILEEMKKSIERGRADFLAGRVYSNEEVMKEMDEIIDNYNQ